MIWQAQFELNGERDDSNRCLIRSAFSFLREGLALFYNLIFVTHYRILLKIVFLHVMAYYH